jgi:DNA repair ATPase RecN
MAWAGAGGRSPKATESGGSGNAPGPLLDVFRKPDFNVASFVRDATSQGQDKLRRLTQQLEDCVSYLDEELQREIIACHEELLLSANSVNDLDSQLGDVKGLVETLKTSMLRMRTEVRTPFEDVKRRTVLLERMQSVSILIRRLSRFLFDARKLRTQMEAPTKDYSKAAQTIHELECVLSECNLERVDVLRAEVVWIKETSGRIRRQAEEDLRNGTKQGNQISLSVALQVFF